MVKSVNCGLIVIRNNCYLPCYAGLNVSFQTFKDRPDQVSHINTQGFEPLVYHKLIKKQYENIKI